MLRESPPNAAIPNDRTEATGWPATLDTAYPILPSVQLEHEGTTISLARLLTCGEAIVLRVPAWSRTYGSSEEAGDAFAALDSKQDDLLHWSIGVSAFGTGWLNAKVDTLVAEFVEVRDEERERLASELEEERARLEEERTAETRISAYFREKKGRYVLDLERGSIKAKPIWSIVFDESWERDRFWDWLGWQSERFEEFAEFMRDGSRLDLERRLLREMLVTEQAVKKQGLGSGGRRPLRFWRGEL